MFTVLSLVCYPLLLSCSLTNQYRQLQRVPSYTDQKALCLLEFNFVPVHALCPVLASSKAAAFTDAPVLLLLIHTGLNKIVF